MLLQLASSATLPQKAMLQQESAALQEQVAGASLCARLSARTRPQRAGLLLLEGKGEQ
jgi:hypothetical protein